MAISKETLNDKIEPHLLAINTILLYVCPITYMLIDELYKNGGVLTLMEIRDFVSKTYYDEWYTPEDFSKAIQLLNEAKLIRFDQDKYHLNYVKFKAVNTALNVLGKHAKNNNIDIQKDLLIKIEYLIKDMKDLIKNE